eukprot:1183422-Prorocentrum_minimum.AAC.3
MVLQRIGKADNNIWRCMMLPAGSTVALDVAIKYLEDCALAELQAVVAHCGAELVGNGRLELCPPSDGARPSRSNGHPLLGVSVRDLAIRYAPAKCSENLVREERTREYRRQEVAAMK